MAYAVTGRGWWGLLAFSALPVILLLAWLRWRDPDARLLGAFAVVPFTMAPSETVACFLIPRTWREMALLVTCAQAAFLLAMLLGWPDDHATRNALHWPAWLGLFYLPALAVVLLRRPPAAVQAPSRPAAASPAI